MCHSSFSLFLVDSSREAKSDTETYDSPIEEKSTPKDDDELFEFISTPPPPMYGF